MRTHETMRRIGLAALLVGTASGAVSAQVPFERLREAAQTPAHWLTYSGSYLSQRYSGLDEVTPANIGDLQLQWVYQTPVFGPWQSTPLVVDGVMYLTQRPQRRVWRSTPGRGACSGSTAIPPRPTTGPAADRTTAASPSLGDLACSWPRWTRTWWRSTRRPGPSCGTWSWPTRRWPIRSPWRRSSSRTRSSWGSAGGDRGIRGFIAALDAATGEEAWRFHTIPGPGEPGHETWEACPPNPETYCDPEAWRHGGAAAWLTGSYDPELNLMYWGLGNPGPDFNRAQRPGDNLYSDSVVALDADTGELRWHFQFTPNDPYDYDAVQIPVLADFERNGVTLKAMLWANRNGFYYVLDRTTGRFLTGRPFVAVNWAEGLDDSGRPVETPQPPGAPTYPGVQGGTNWYSPSFSPRTGLFYVPAWEDYASVFDGQPQEYEPGRSFVGGRPRTAAPVPDAPTVPGLTRGPINTWTDAAGSGAVVALDALTGAPQWKFEMTDVTSSGILTTASDLLFTGTRSGYFQALDARTGDLLWRTSLGGQITNGPMTYEVDGRQYVAVIAGHSLSTFALRD